MLSSKDGGHMIVGIDIGGTTTKIVGFDKDKIVDLMTIKASDPITSASGALGKLMYTHGLKLSDIRKIAITGVGASYIESDILGIPVVKVNEFEAIGLGGAHLSGLNNIIVLSLGTGTAIVKVENEKITHLGGTGVGGGTLMGLSEAMFGMSDFNEIIEMAEKGSLENIDLTIGDISKGMVGHLIEDITASNFGKMNVKATPNDKALGIINLIFQTIGVISLFASSATGIKDIVVTGKLGNVDTGKTIIKRLTEFKAFDGQFVFPDKSEYSTALGAAISQAPSDGR